MTSAWIENGPVSSPSRPLAYGVGVVLVLVAVAGLGLGFRASMRDPGSAASSGGVRTADDGSTDARPIVVLPPPVSAPATDANKTQTAQTDAEKAAAAARVAAAQQVQAKPATPNQNIDEILTSASEKPPAPVKPAADEAPPAPPKSDVPF